MWEKLQYGLLYGWVKAHAVLPMGVLYLLSDLFYLIIYKVVGYRIKVVRGNMKASFPQKTDAELHKLESDFYHHFSDYVMETIKLAHISHKEVQSRAFINNPQLIDGLMEKGHTCFILLLGHYGNWEWYTASTSFFKNAEMHQIYRPLTNKAFDRLFVQLRTQFGAFGIKKNNTIRDIVRLKQNKTRSLAVFLADQTPSRANLHYWTQFLNQETAILTGPERIARKLNLPVIYMDVQKVKRGYYTVDTRLITETPKETPEFWITEQYARMMEQTIMRNPAYWLWTHKRWKHKRIEN